MKAPLIAVTIVRGQRCFWCKGCGELHSHRDRGDGLYLSQCPPGKGYRRSGYFLVTQGAP